MTTKRTPRPPFVVIVAAAAALAVAGCGSGAAVGQGLPGSSRTAPASPDAASTVAVASSSGAGDLTINLKEFSIDVPSTTLSPGQTPLTITNGGAGQHELLVFKTDLDPSQLPLDPTGDVNEDGAGVNKISDGDNIDPGGSQSRIVDLSATGSYLLVCNLPGHFKAGMVKRITVGVPEETTKVSLKEFTVTPATTTLAKGAADLVITNDGKVQHELLVFHTDLDPSQFPLDADGTVQEDGPGMNKVSDGDNIDPGDGQSRSVDLSEPGTYVLLCNLPGHFKAGMYTKVTVTA